MDFASQVQTVTSTESFNSGIHLQRKADGNKQSCCSSSCFVSDRDPRLFLLSLFLSLLLMFSPEIFQMNCVGPVKIASRLSYSPGNVQLAAHTHPRLLTVAVARWYLRQTLAPGSSQPSTQNPRDRDRDKVQQRRKPPPARPPTPSTPLRNRGTCLISGSVAAFEVLNQFF